MDAEEFRQRGREMVEYIADYMTTLEKRRVTPEVDPGYLKSILPGHAPKKGEKWEDIMNDVEKAILPGITHWQHPNFHAYFPAGNSYPSILGDMLGNALGCIGFSWAASPACTELETLVLDWLAKMIGLPHQFVHDSGEGGGVIQGSASECVLLALLAARSKAIEEWKRKHPHEDESIIMSKLVGYHSKLAHSCVERAGMIGFVKMRQLEVDDRFSLRGPTLEEAIEEDKKQGLIPFFVCASLGTTSVCSFDNVAEIGKLCTREGIYLHVDAAYAGNAFICPEYRYLLKGVEHVNSLNFNTNKWLQVNFDCSLMWSRHVDELTKALTVDPLYLKHKNEGQAVDLRHWSIPLSRRFRALKLWFVIRTYGVEGLQNIIRKQSNLAKQFEALVLEDDRFEILGEVTMGLACFRLLGPNSRTQKLYQAIEDSGKLHMVPAMLNDDYVIRFALCTEHAKEEDIMFAWNVISDIATELFPHEYESNKLDLTRLRNAIYEEEDMLTSKDAESFFPTIREHIPKAEAALSSFFNAVSDPRMDDPRMLTIIQ